MDHPTDTSDASDQSTRRFVCTVLGLMSGTVGAVGIFNALGNIFPALGRRIPYEYFLMKPPGDIETSGCCFIGGVFFLTLAVAFIAFGWTPSGASPDFPHAEKFRKAAQIRGLTGMTVFAVPGMLFLVFGIALCVSGDFAGILAFLFGIFLIVASLTVEPY